MTLNIELPPDIEAKYAAEAQSKGVPLERHVRDRLIETAPFSDFQNHAENQPAHPLKLPAMKGTVIGSLHRRDIYDDPR
jgi:hypothetical protein